MLVSTCVSCIPSTAWWKSNTRCALSEILSRASQLLRPLAMFFSSSSKNPGRWMTTPLPIRDSHSSQMIPQGRMWKSYALSPTTINIQLQSLWYPIYCLTYDGVPRVVAALAPGDHLGLLGQEVHQLPLALVTPLKICGQDSKNIW